jgi:hypothetical protein
MESEHSRGELMACCHKRAVKGLVQNSPEFEPLEWPHLTESAATAMSVAVEASAHDEKHMFNKLVAMAVGSRGSWLSVLDIARNSIFIDGRFLRHISKWFNSLLNSVAKLSKVDGNMDELCVESSKMWAHTARVAEVPMWARWWHCEVMSGKIIKHSRSTGKRLEHWVVLVLACMPINHRTDLKRTCCS